MLSQLLLAASALIMRIVGMLHLSGTFFSSDLRPRDPALETRMKAVSPVVTSHSIMWKGWVGFNAGFGLSLVLFGVLYGYLTIMQFQVLRQGWFLLVVGALFLSSLVVLAKRYMFRIPLVIFAGALVLFVLDAVLSASR